MNILVLSWRDIRHPLAGGAEQVMQEHMKGWVEAGHDVTHFSSRISGKEKTMEIVEGITFIRKGYQFLGVNVAGFFWYLLGKHAKFDLVVDEFHGIPFFTPLYVRAKRLAVIQEIAGEVWLKNQLPFPVNLIIGGLGFLLEPLIFLLYKNAQFMTASESTKGDLVKVGIPEKNINIVPHGLIKVSVGELPKETRKTVIYLGAIAKDKGIEDALRVFSILKETLPDSKFWVVGKGEGSYLTYIEKQSLELGLGDNIKFWGYVSQEKKFELLTRAHILINPSVREGWGLVNIEANSVGTPVVAYRSQGLVDSVKEGVSGVFCNTNTPESMAEIILKLFESPNRLSSLSKSSKKWSENFNWKTSIGKSLKLIERTYAGH